MPTGILSCYRCGRTSHLVRECPMPAESPQAPANNRVNQTANSNSTNNNISNNGNIQGALTDIAQALQALTNKIDKMHTPTQVIITNYMVTISCTITMGNAIADTNTSHATGTKQQTQIAEVEVCDCEECNHCPDDCTDCDSNPITSTDSPDSETPKCWSPPIKVLGLRTSEGTNIM